MGERTYTDDDLVTAVASSHSWRGVLRHLGLLATSAGAARSVRRRADQLGLDHSHFTGQRRWSEDDLRVAIGASRTWGQVQGRLGLAIGSGTALLRGHALRLGIDTDHLARAAGPRAAPASTARHPDTAHLSRAGSMLAASWFTMTGHDVAWPLEPCRYDLLVSCNGTTSRVQVKTSMRRRNGRWEVSLTTSGHPTARSPGRHHYDPEEIDSFFVITGDLDCYLIPIAQVAGLGAICTSAYSDCRVGRIALSRPEAQPT
jgi:hypothetical protein